MSVATTPGTSLGVYGVCEIAEFVRSIVLHKLGSTILAEYNKPPFHAIIMPMCVNLTHWSGRADSGESASGTVVTVSETVSSNGPSFEISEAVSEISSGDSETLFFTLELSPNE